MTPVRLEPEAPRSPVKHSTTEPRRSLFVCLVCIILKCFQGLYPLINYLVILRERTLTGRKTMLCNITRRQLRAISVVATSLLSGRINPLKRDSTFLKRSKGILETLSSRRISFERKKRLLNRHHSLIPVMLKTIYLIKTIVGDMVRM